jgi:hypothetical protein
MRLRDVDRLRGLPHRPGGQRPIRVTAHKLFALVMPRDGLQGFGGLAPHFGCSRLQVP